MTSDERRDVARKIREYVDAYGDKIDDAEMVLLGTVWRRGEFNEVIRPTSEVELLAMVADLIDPTCYLVGTTSEEGLYDGLTIFRHELSCGHTCETVWAEPPAHCDVCGARVVDDDGLD
ncbi:hypothetical protein [Mitsuokella sp.]|uniref:hypothetical protein n=1 Tax=Mitsuokella sp. TaxID=2049034 RepID=UPI002A815274|nr:hypothetical protein [Mitsuokella sp.]MDY4474919.1 hypothetical protein [Mitsuokella sp.]